MIGWLAQLERRAQLRARAGLTRQLRPRRPGDPVVDLAGNDYLGLARHPEVVAAAAGALAEYGLGATGSRLVRGSTDAHAALEADLAGWLGAGRALVYSSGYLANLGVLAALAGPRTVLVADAHCHASLVDGARLAGAATVVTPHRDVPAVDAALQEAAGARAIVVTESVFSVDGDLAPLPELHRVARRHGALLLVDDAHGMGVVGPGGAGGVAAAGLAGEPDLVVTATLSKALGGAGGVVAGPEPLIRHLVDTGRTFIFDTALPPAVAAGAHAALRLARSGTGERRRAELRRRVAATTARLRQAGLAPPGADAAGGAPPGADVAGGATPGGTAAPPAAGLVSVTAPSAAAAVAWAAGCAARGVAVGCFRPPATPDHRSRLRLTVNAGVPGSDFAAAVEVVVSVAAEPAVAAVAPAGPMAAAR